MTHGQDRAARHDRWREMSAVGRTGEAAVAQRQSGEAAHAAAVRLLADVAPLEGY